MRGLSASTGEHCVFGHLGLVFFSSCFVFCLLFCVISAPVSVEASCVSLHKYDDSHTTFNPTRSELFVINIF